MIEKIFLFLLILEIFEIIYYHLNKPVYEFKYQLSVRIAWNQYKTIDLTRLNVSALRQEGKM